MLTSVSGCGFIQDFDMEWRGKRSNEVRGKWRVDGDTKVHSADHHIEPFLLDNPILFPSLPNDL